VATDHDAGALVKFDFEQKYFVHPDRQVWDFSIIRPDSVYHIFYHTIHESTPHATFADTIWHATSPDLSHWNIEGPILTSGQGPWDSSAIWAPDVFRDEENDRWVIAYTGCDSRMNQRICFAFSDDLHTWTKAAANPVVVPDTNVYVWNPDNWWSDFRDAYVYRQDDTWHMLVTAKQWLGVNTGVLYHATSTDLVTWQDVGYLFANDGTTPARVLESPQYHVIGDYHHLLFGEYDTPGVTVVTNDNPDDLSMNDRILLDYGYAPEVDEFDPGHRIYSRLAPFRLPNVEDLAYVVRHDTLVTEQDGSELVIRKPHPLAGDWAVHSGTANLGNPIFGDNPTWRSEASAGLVGHGYYSSKEYYQGPLSGRGGPGTQLGDSVKGLMESHPFTVTGQRMYLLVGGGDYPASCYVALVDISDSTIIHLETGGGHETMTWREWDLVPHQGKQCVIRVVDDETGPMGYISVDEIEEILDLDPPAGPTALVASYRAEGVDLDWDDAPEEDFSSHRIYRSLEPEFQAGQGNLLEEVAVSAWTDPTNDPWLYHYKVSTVDRIGNESQPTAPTGVSGQRLPTGGRSDFLAAAVPNPFNPLTRISFEISRPGPLSLKIYDPAGRLVRVLVDGHLPAGAHFAEWEGRDGAGRAVAAGLYLYRLETTTFAETRRMMLVR
jgi:predicted GH43/DUF377 family glycosyl hydrolase